MTQIFRTILHTADNERFCKNLSQDSGQLKCNSHVRGNESKSADDTICEYLFRIWAKYRSHKNKYKTEGKLRWTYQGDRNLHNMNMQIINRLNICTVEMTFYTVINWKSPLQVYYLILQNVLYNKITNQGSWSSLF